MRSKAALTAEVLKASPTQLDTQTVEAEVTPRERYTSRSRSTPTISASDPGSERRPTLRGQPREGERKRFRMPRRKW